MFHAPKYDEFSLEPPMSLLAILEGARVHQDTDPKPDCDSVA